VKLWRALLFLGACADRPAAAPANVSLDVPPLGGGAADGGSTELVPSEVPPGPPVTECFARIHGPDRQLVNGVAAARDGRIAVVGTSDVRPDFDDGAADAGAGGSGSFVIVYNAHCRPLWHAWYPGTSTLRAVAFDDDGSLIIAGSAVTAIDFGVDGGALPPAGSDDVVVAKLNATYGIVFAKRFGDVGMQRASTVAVDATGNIYLGGIFWGTLTFGCPASSIAAGARKFLAKLDPRGDCVFERSLKGTGTSDFRQIAVERSGAVIAAGIDAPNAFVDRIDANGEDGWHHTEPARGFANIALGPSGDVFLVAGMTIARLRGADGAEMWRRPHAGVLGPAGIAATMPGGVVVSGTTFFTRLDANGEPLYAENLVHSQMLAVVATTPTNGTVMAGSVRTPTMLAGTSFTTDDGRDDAFVLVLSK